MSLKDWLLLGVFAAAGLLFWLRGKRTARISGKKPGQSNSRAILLLEEAGYEVIRVKPNIAVKMEIDDKDYTFELKGDYLVTREGHKFLVRVRRDSKPARLHSKLWRGTLLRDALAFRVSGVVVLNAEKESLHEVRFR